MTTKWKRHTTLIGPVKKFYDILVPITNAHNLINELLLWEAPDRYLCLSYHINGEITAMYIVSLLVQTQCIHVTAFTHYWGDSSRLGMEDLLKMCLNYNEKFKEWKWYLVCIPDHTDSS